MAESLPNPSLLRRSLSSCLGKPCSFRPASAESIKDFKPASYLTFVDDDESVHLMCACDTAFVGYTSASLADITDEAIKDAVASERLNESDFENFHEICNMACSSAFNDSYDFHLRLNKRFSKLPDDLASAERDGESVLYQVRIGSYGTSLLRITRLAEVVAFNG